MKRILVIDDDNSVRVAIKTLGATYCRRKPFGPAQLMMAVNSCLGESSSRDDGAADDGAQALTAPGRQTVMLDGLN